MQTLKRQPHASAKRIRAEALPSNKQAVLLKYDDTSAIPQQWRESMEAQHRIVFTRLGREQALRAQTVRRLGLDPCHSGALRQLQCRRRPRIEERAERTRSLARKKGLKQRQASTSVYVWRKENEPRHLYPSIQRVRRSMRTVIPSLRRAGSLCRIDPDAQPRYIDEVEEIGQTGMVCDRPELREKQNQQKKPG